MYQIRRHKCTHFLMFTILYRPTKVPREWTALYSAESLSRYSDVTGRSVCEPVLSKRAERAGTGYACARAIPSFDKARNETI